MSGDPNRSGWHVLRAGALEAWLVPGDGALRGVRWDGEEVLHALYGAIRDRNWDTVPVEVRGLEVREYAAGFRVEFVADARPVGVPFAWRGRIAGGADGRLEYVFDGTAEGSFLRNRIGLCVLHPATCAGAAVEVEHTDGTVERGVFPEALAPHQPFRAVRALKHRTARGAVVAVRLEGETFEMEDQRNWTDASFKTYGTPLELPFPVEIQAGEVVRQRVCVACTGGGVGPHAKEEVAVLRLEGSGGWLPGLGLQAGAEDLAPADLALLRSAGLAFVRVDVHPGGDGWEEPLARGAVLAGALGYGVELAVRLDGVMDGALEALAHAPALAMFSAQVERVLAVRRDAPVSTAADVERLRAYLALAVPRALFGLGTDADFVQLNRARPDTEGCDFVAFTINPQVHAFDDLSVVETLEMQEVVVRQARVLAQGRRVVVSPITLRSRFNPAATGARSAWFGGGLPHDADRRQPSVFTAMWTLGSIRAVAEGGATAACFYETAGVRGVFSGAARPPLPPPFPPPGMPFPVLEVFRLLAPLRGGFVEPARCSRAPEVEAMVVRCGGVRRLFLANFGPEVRWTASDASLEPLRAEIVLAEDGRRGTVDRRAPLAPRSLVAADLPADGSVPARI